MTDPMAVATLKNNLTKCRKLVEELTADKSLVAKQLEIICNRHQLTETDRHELLQQAIRELGGNCSN